MFSAPDSETASIPLKNFEGVRREEEAGSIEKYPETKNGSGVQREKRRSGRRGIRSLKARVGQECCISRGGQMDQVASGVIQAEGVRGGSYIVGMCGISRRSRYTAGRAAAGVIAA